MEHLIPALIGSGIFTIVAFIISFFIVMGTRS